jgi:tetratricopeptide (TPR) repeat protein
MSILLEIFGRAITIDTPDLIWHWLNADNQPQDDTKSSQSQQLNQVLNLMSDMKLDAAQSQLTLYLSNNPACTRGRMAAAAICLHRNRLNEAIDQLNSVYMRQPNNTMALYALGHCYERLGKEPQAVEFYQDCLKFKNYLQLPAQRLAAIYFKNGQLEKTIQQYELLKDQHPDDISTILTLGHLYIADTRYTKAIERFNTAILIHPDNFISGDNDIEQLIQNQQLHEALEQLEDLIAQQPDRADLIVKRADLLTMLGATAEAVAQYQQAIRICPDLLEATIKLGTQYLQMHAEQLAAQQFNKAVEINDKIVDAYVGLATAQKIAGNAPEALQTLSLAAAIQPNSSFLFAQTASLVCKAALAADLPAQDRNDSNLILQAVIQAHRHQIASQPQNPDLHYRLGVLMLSAGRIRNALESFTTALNINPTYTRAQSKLTICLHELGRTQAALEHLTPPAYLDQDTLTLHYKTALLYCDKLRFASSLITLHRHFQENFVPVDCTVNVSIVLQNLGLLDRVSAMWENLSATATQAAHTGRS